MKRVNQHLYVAPQPSDADLEKAARAGVRLVVNNRPDGEEAGQPSAAQQRARAGSLGMDYVHIPVTSGAVRLEDVRAFQNVVSDAEGPVLAHCRTGARSLTLFALGEVLDGRLQAQDIDDLGRRMGIDLAGAKKWLEANRQA
ncbi:MAG: TIGR01244 family phosphatase [Rhizobiales bacterium]|nr:TIGR01244 family phosphatase [Hyphomicrobiales bacterium]